MSEMTYTTLTPAHFLILNPKIGLPANTEDGSDDTDFNTETSSIDRLFAT